MDFSKIKNDPEIVEYFDKNFDILKRLFSCRCNKENKKDPLGYIRALSKNIIFNWSGFDFIRCGKGKSKTKLKQKFDIGDLKLNEVIKSYSIDMEDAFLTILKDVGDHKIFVPATRK